jgi:hypothetical protein
MFRIASLLIGGAALLVAGCTHVSEPKSQGEVAVAATLKVTEDGAGGYKFAYSAPYFDEKGNFDFSKKGADGNVVRLTFTIADGSVSGLKFKADARDAMWIVDKKNVDPATGSPRGPYEGRQFHSFAVSADGLTLSVVDENNDGVLYRYGLRFDLGGATVIDDPDGQNGGSGGHG